MSARSAWPLWILLPVAHLVLLAAVYLLPVLFNGVAAPQTHMLRSMPASLISAQCVLLATYWALSPWSWLRRTLFFFIGATAFVVAHAVVLLPLSRIASPPAETLLRLIHSSFQMVVEETLVLAVFLELLRPVWGVLSRSSPPPRENMTILFLLRLTVLSAVVAVLVQQSVGFLEEPLWYAGSWLLEVGLVASCAWLMFAPRRQWIGAVGCLVALGGLVWHTPDEIIRAHGRWHWLPHLLLKTSWILATHAIVRWYGFRLCRGSTQ
ncbi:MAG: hypothetical protein KatS3mg111_1116 [Pirellulaceae bacterium]|nr:MAG: hypothetical protein KatS3mg111_1116 [Pirellulaceae bacterium]